MLSRVQANESLFNPYCASSLALLDQIPTIDELIKMLEDRGLIRKFGTMGVVRRAVIQNLYESLERARAGAAASGAGVSGGAQPLPVVEPQPQPKLEEATEATVEV
eukprot:TRINITY_DN9776_c0_g1_i1.p2 TRINITY_DN9776_c0_g1~~TRINITY_DN9776_c0_g1_i1.p2  ORF type:complete len:106 (+),score=20.28 TRINITY_DN9776_c0_g1_i1:209-526(+)